MFKKFVFSVLLSALHFILPAQVIHVSTGTDNLGNPIAIGNSDPNWNITNLSTSAKVESPHPFWENAPVAGTNAQWVDMSGTLGSSFPNGPTTVHTFERSFTVNPGVAAIQCNFSIAYDDSLVSIEVVRPDLTTVPLTYTPSSTWYHLTPINNLIPTNGLNGVFKIRANINFYDGIAGFICSGNVELKDTVNTCVGATQDAMLHEFVPTTNYGSAVTQQASRWTYDALGGNGFYSTKTLEQFDLSSIPSGAIITSAVMTLKVCSSCTPYNQHYDLSGLGNAGIVEQVTSSWNENMVTWNTAPTATSTASATIPSPGNASVADLVVNVTSMVQNMVSTGNNFGFLIRLADNSDYYHSFNYATKENADATLVPQLCISYTLPSCNLTVSTTGSGCGTAACPYQCIGSPSGGTFSGPSGLNSTTGIYIGAIPTSGLPYTYTYTAGTCSYIVSGLITKPTSSSLTAPTLSAYTGTTGAGTQVVVTWPCTGNTCGEWYEFQLAQNGLPVSGCASVYTSIAPSNILPYGYTPLPAGTCGKIISCPGLVNGQNYQVRMRINRCGAVGQWSAFVNTAAARASNQTDVAIKDHGLVEVYPNPIQNELTVAINSKENSTYKLDVLDISGRVLIHSEQTVLAGSNQLHVPVRQLTKGAYVLKVYDANGLFHTEKLIKSE
ncbi:MAG: T9SS type A sorting domain-containing protein [Chitinophagaceae bacterium]|nr:T9SS type A sorting domain-containing protein [Chitinophagaceae bacterium]